MRRRGHGRSRLPPAHLTVRLLVKSFFFWLVVRGALLGLGVPGPLAAVDVPGPAPLASLGIVAVVLLILWADMALLRERLFLENLGVGRAGMIRLAFGFLMVIEVTTQVAVRVQVP